MKYARAHGARIFSSHYTSLKFTKSNNMAVTTFPQGGLYSMGCLDILSSVAGCVSPPSSKPGHLVQQCLCLSMSIGLFSFNLSSFFSCWYENINISNTRRRGGWTGLGTVKVGCFPLFSSYPTFLPPGHVVPDCQACCSHTRALVFQYY